MEGMYVIEFLGSAGYGGAALTFKDGKVYGFDLGGGVYDGHYRSNEVSGTTDVEVVVKLPAGKPTVIRGIAQPFDWSILVEASIPDNVTSAEVLFKTNLGDTISAKFTRMRGLPLAA